MTLPNRFWWTGSLLFLLLTGCQSSTSHEQDAGTSSTDSLPSSPRFHPLDEVIGLSERWTGDLDGMIERRRIRALVPYSRTSYYIDGAERGGIAYEALSVFEKKFNEKLGNTLGQNYVRVVFIPVTRDRLLPALLEGYGDIAAAGLTITPQRRTVVDFTEPILTGAREVVVTGPAAQALIEMEDLPGTTVFLRRSSSFYEHLRIFNDSLRRAGRPAIRIESVSEYLEDEDILEMVNAGLLPLTIMDEFKARFWSQVFDSLTVRSDLATHTGSEIAWAVRPGSPRLKETLDGFIRENRKGTLLGNIIFNRYLKNTGYVTNAFSPEDRARFRATREYFIQYGAAYDLDWLILAALGYQESRLNQSVISSAGAVGVMQVRPETAADPNVGIPNVYDLEDNIHAGAKYLRFLIDRYFVHPEIDSLNAGLLALAAYNAGPKRIQDLRAEARRLGLDHNVWFNNVELIAAREIGRETVQYVSNIFKYYISYRSLNRYAELTGREMFEDD